MNKIGLILCGLIFFGNFSLEAQEWKIQNDPYYKHKKSQFEVLMNNSKCTTMMLGDSITDEGRWEELLNTKDVQNRGISGDTTSGVLDRLPTTVSPHIKQVFIMIGVNDILRGKDIDEIFTNYQKIVKFFQDKNIKVYIQSTLYVGANRNSFNEKIEELNSKLELFAKNSKIAFIDLNTFFARNKALKQEFTTDDLHINGKAYLIWAKEIKKFF